VDRELTSGNLESVSGFGVLRKHFKVIFHLLDFVFGLLDYEFSRELFSEFWFLSDASAKALLEASALARLLSRKVERCTKDGCLPT